MHVTPCVKTLHRQDRPLPTDRCPPPPQPNTGTCLLHSRVLKLRYPRHARFRQMSLAADMVEPAAFDVFKIAPNGEPVLVEGAFSLDAAVARVVRLGECFPGEYVIASQATGRRILFTKQGVIKRS